MGQKFRILVANAIFSFPRINVKRIKLTQLLSHLTSSLHFEIPVVSCDHRISPVVASWVTSE